MIETSAETPSCRPSGLPVTSTTTGYAATPPVLVDSSPISATVPYTGSVAPSGVISTWLPTAIRATSVSPTVTSTCHASVPTSVNAAVPALVLLVPAYGVSPDLRPPLPDPDVPDPD